MDIRTEAEKAQDLADWQETHRINAIDAEILPERDREAARTMSHVEADRVWSNGWPI